MPAVRDLVTWAIVGVVYVVVVSPAVRSPSDTAVVWIGGGLVAGMLVLVERQRWWPLVVVAAGVSFATYAVADMPLAMTVVQTAADVLALLAFAAVIRSHRQQEAGLGADIAWVAFAALGAAAIRLVPLLVVTVGWSDVVEAPVESVTVEIGLSTVIGLIAGTGTVLGLARWPKRGGLLTGHREQILGAAVLVMLLVLLFFTPFGALVPGAEYLIVPILLAAAVRYPVPLTATFTGLSVLAMAIALAQGTGAFSFGGEPTVEEVFATQVFILVVTVSVFVLAAVEAGRRRAQDEITRSSTLLSAVFRESPVAAAWLTVTTDGYPVIREANPVFLALVGLVGEDVSGVRLSSLLSPSRPLSLADLEEGVELQSIAPDGSVRWLHPTISRRFAETRTGTSVQVEEFTVLVLEDVTADRVSEELLWQQSRRDTLTGLPNRAALVERLDEAIHAASTDEPVGLLIIDIDDLKVVNNGLGHLAGDQLIIKVAQRLLGAVAPRDVVVRTGGDEFAVLRPEPRPDQSLDGLVTTLLGCVEEPFVIDERTVRVSVSIGAAESDPSTELPGDLLRSADIALQRAKTSGRHQAARFEPGEDRPARERMGVEGLLRDSLESGTLVCLFQPIALTETSRVVAAETLVRLRDHSGGLVPPSAFLPLAAELGLLGPLTDQVFEQACRAARTWRDMGHDIRVAFNAPPQWLNSDALVLVDRLVEEHGIPMSSLTVEVTEEETLSAGRSAIETLTELRGRGMHVAIDDFGTGYAGLDSFRSVPANIVKVDRSFIAEMVHNSEDFALVRSMLDLVYRFGKLAVAEGVEDEAQLDALRRMGCEYVQGFYLSRPVPIDDFPAGDVLPLQPVRELPVAL